MNNIMYSMEGTWSVKLADGTEGVMRLPGTLDESGIGHKDCGANQWHPDAALGNADGEIDKDAPIATRFTRRFTYEGEARISHSIEVPDYGRDRLFVRAERARALRLMVDGKECGMFRQGTLSTPYIFELTGIEPGKHEFVFISDNSYPGMPKDAICYSSAATDETQTNWNGIIGELVMYTRPESFISGLYVYPKSNKSSRIKTKNDFCLDVCVETELMDKSGYKLVLSSDALKDDVTADVPDVDGVVRLGKLQLGDTAMLWDEECPELFEMTARLYGKDGKICCDEHTVRFGIRSFGDNGEGRLALNGRTIFLRSEANCAEFPETGHAPMSVDEWKKILLRYQSYGINCVRFHSHCAPEAAFTAADEIGMLLQPELSNWNPRDAFETDESYEYYKRELEGIIRTLANHPSFVMLTLGNELQTKELGRKRMDSLVKLAKDMDGTRLYANGSNTFYGEEGCDAGSDFYTSQSCHEVKIRGTFSGMHGYINESYPSASHDYDTAMESIREQYKKPVFSFEVGQFEVLPDFDELDSFKGVSLPINLELIKKRVEDRGLMDEWKEYVEATGELSRLAYREEIEAAMRTKELSGISLLGLQDFPGQGTALVGMMNSHLEPKPYDFAEPSGFRKFFKECMPLVKLPRYTYEAGERLCAAVDVANFGKSDIEGELVYRITRRDGGNGKASDLKSGSLGKVICMAGMHTMAGTLDIALDFTAESTALMLYVEVVADGRVLTDSEYPVWVYEKVTPVCPENVYESKVFDDKVRDVLRAGGRVYLTPDADKDSLPESIKTQFTTDFWSVGTFSDQEGGMGQLIDVKHPVFRKFPTDKHTDWQWWIMATKRAVILPRKMKAIITEMDSYAFLRPMAQLIEFRCMGGKVLLSTMELHNSQKYPEARALLAAIYDYVAGDEFEPDEELGENEIMLDLKLGL